MFRVKLQVALIGLFTLVAAGCNDASSPTNKPSTPAKTSADGKAGAAAEGSGAK